MFQRVKSESLSGFGMAPRGRGLGDRGRGRGRQAAGVGAAEAGGEAAPAEGATPATAEGAGGEQPQQMKLIRVGLICDVVLWPAVPLAETLDGWLDEAVASYLKV